MTHEEHTGDHVPLGMSSVREGPAVTVRLVGELDMVGAGMLGDFVEHCTRDGLGLVLDVSGLEFIDSTGSRALADAAVRARRRGARSVALRTATGGAVLKMLRMTGMDTLFDDARPAP